MHGVSVSRNAVLATQLTIGDDRTCHLFPHALPALLGQAMSKAIGEVIARDSTQPLTA